MSSTDAQVCQAISGSDPSGIGLLLGWRHPTNDPPEKTDKYLTVWRDGKAVFYQVCAFIKDSWNYGDVWTNNFSNGEIILWRPLPPLPEGVGNE